MLGDTSAADVDVGAATLLIGEQDANAIHHRSLLGIFGTQEPADVVGVGDADAAFAGRHGANLGAVVALGVRGEVGDHSRWPSARAASAPRCSISEASNDRL